MSEPQAQGAICTEAKKIFLVGNWKTPSKSEPTDPNTLPYPSNTRRTETYVKALVLAAIANEIMASNPETVVTCPNDCSSQSGVGSYVVQSFCINGKQRALPSSNIEYLHQI